MRLGELLRQKTELGMSASDLAVKLGVTRQAVSQWMSGASSPGLEMARRIQDLTKIPMADWTEPSKQSSRKTA